MTDSGDNSGDESRDREGGERLKKIITQKQQYCEVREGKEVQEGAEGR